MYSLYGWGPFLWNYVDTLEFLDFYDYFYYRDIWSATSVISSTTAALSANIAVLA